MISNSALTAAQKRDISHRMDSYDSHMNQYGHYSIKKVRASARSPILDSLVAQGVTLASDYASRFPAVTESEHATPEVNTVSEQVDTPIVESEHLQTKIKELEDKLETLKRSDPAYINTYRALSRARAKL